jgi:tetratricopeptide (TPR) repeat protein
VGCREHVPVWHEATADWVKKGKLVLLGVTQEQHADRCRLFAQWKQFHWPILYDPINVLDLFGVPLVVAIDEHGIVRSIDPQPARLARDFLEKSFPNDAPAAPAPKTPQLAPERAIPLFNDLKQTAQKAGTADAWRRYGDALALWGGAARINDALDAYDKARQQDPKDGPALFRLGVCYRLRYDSEGRRPGDFQAAIDAWNQALQLEPNRYIWRRRIQQYGPRLDQPYAFFDWVEPARREITARGQKPVALAVPLVGAEIAQPVKQFSEAGVEAAPPDPDGKIHRDQKNLIEAETTVIPSRLHPGQAARVQIVFRPNGQLKAHWNNEGTALQMWVDAPPGWKVTRRLLTSIQPKEAESNEPRTLDFEIQAPAIGETLLHLPVYALYNVCESTGGKCLFLRKDIEIRIAVSK